MSPTEQVVVGGIVLCLILWLAVSRFRKRDAAAFLEKFRARLRPTEVLVPIRPATWSSCCWRCGTLTEKRKLLSLSQSGFAGVRQSVELDVPFCASHTSKRLVLAHLGPRLALLAGASATLLAQALKADPSQGWGPSLGLGVAVGAVLHRFARRYRDGRIPIQLVWADHTLGWCVVRINNADRAKTLRGELAGDDVSLQ